MKIKNKRDIYCKYAFWEAFFEKEEEVICDRLRRRLWDAFYEFLSNNNLYFDIPKNEVNEGSDGGKNLITIWHQKGGAGIKFIPRSFPNFEEFSDNDDNCLNAVYLTNLETNICQNLSERFGVIVLNLSMIFSADHVYVNTEKTFEYHNNMNWSYLMELREKNPSIGCCNSLLITDRYLLSDQNERNIFDNNLKPIFEALLPTNLDNGITFNICIIAENICEFIEEKKERIEKLIEEIRPNLNYSLNIFDSRKIHDRSIITNNIILISGAGFDIIGYDGRPLRFTTISLNFPFLDPNTSNKYIDWIYNVLKVKKKCRKFQENYWGNRETKHHLLDYFYEKPIPGRATYTLGNAFPETLLQAIAAR